MKRDNMNALKWVWGWGQALILSSGLVSGVQYTVIPGQARGHGLLLFLCTAEGRGSSQAVRGILMHANPRIRVQKTFCTLSRPGSMNFKTRVHCLFTFVLIWKMTKMKKENSNNVKHKHNLCLGYWGAVSHFVLITLCNGPLRTAEGGLSTFCIILKQIKMYTSHKLQKTHQISKSDFLLMLIFLLTPVQHWPDNPLEPCSVSTMLSHLGSIQGFTNPDHTSPVGGAEPVAGAWMTLGFWNHPACLHMSSPHLSSTAGQARGTKTAAGYDMAKTEQQQNH